MVSYPLIYSPKTCNKTDQPSLPNSHRPAQWDIKDKPHKKRITLDREHFEKVAEASSDFDKYLIDTYGGANDSERARTASERADSYFTPARQQSTRPDYLARGSSAPTRIVKGAGKSKGMERERERDRDRHSSATKFERGEVVSEGEKSESESDSEAEVSGAEDGRGHT